MMEKSKSLLQKVSLLNSENEKLKTQIRESAKNKTLVAASITQKLNSEVDRLRTENELLQASLNATKIEQEKEGLESVSLADYEILQGKNSVLSTQIRSLTTENFKLKNMLTEVSAAGNMGEVNSQKLVSENAKLRSDAVLKDNKIIALQAALTQANSKIGDYQQLKQQISMLQSRNKDLTNSYAALEAAAGEVTPSNADGEMKALQERYIEQQRELERMADQMEEQRQSFKLEQRRLETMLFDPAVTEQKQLARLAALENELKVANQALEEQRAMYENGTPVSPSTRQVMKPVADMTNSERVTMMQMSKEIQRLRDEIERLRRTPRPVTIEKAEVSERKVVIARGQTLETATPIDEYQKQVAENKTRHTGCKIFFCHSNNV